MLEYSELPPLARVYQEVCLIAAETHTAARQVPVLPVEGKDLRKPPSDRELPSSEPKAEPPGQRRPKRSPARLINPDPVLPGLQIMITQDFQAKIIVTRRC